MAILNRVKIFFIIVGYQKHSNNVKMVRMLHLYDRNMTNFVDCVTKGNKCHECRELVQSGLKHGRLLSIQRKNSALGRIFSLMVKGF